MASNYGSSSCFGSIISLDAPLPLQPIKTMSVITDYEVSRNGSNLTSTSSSVGASIRSSREANRACSCTLF